MSNSFKLPYYSLSSIFFVFVFCFCIIFNMFNMYSLPITSSFTTAKNEFN